MGNLLKRLDKLEQHKGTGCLVACWEMEEGTRAIQCGGQTWHRQEGETLADLVARAAAELSGKPGIHWLAAV